MATTKVDETGRLILANATPFLWKRSTKNAEGMSAWAFPGNVQPGQTVTVAIAFARDDGHGQASYQMEVEEGQSGPGNPTFTLSATCEGLLSELPAEMNKAGYFAVPPAPHKIAEAGWQKGCAVSFTIGALGGDHPNLRGGHKSRSFKGVGMAALNPAPALGAERAHGNVLPNKPKSSSERDVATDSDDGDRGLNAFLGGIGRQLKAVTEGVGGLLNECGIGNPARPSGGTKEGAWTAGWMKAYGPALADLTLAEMSLPGTHDSGTVSMHNPVVGPWATTQNLQLTEQLHGGVRVLDFRVGFVGAEAQKADGVADGLALVHDKHRTNLSLQLALELVKEFVLHHPREVVLLDFHRFPGLGHGPPHEKAGKVVKESLGTSMIHPKHRNEPLGKLLKQKGRIAVLWNANEGRDPFFWPGLRQAWTGAEDLSALHNMAKTELGAKKGHLWSLPLVLPAGVPRPVPHIPEQLDDWVAVGGVWQDHANIVAVDFVEETQLVRNCIGACLLKAARARAGAGGGHAPAHGGGKR